MKAVYTNGDTNFSKVIEKSVEFHNCIMKASHNELFFVIYSYINDLIREGRIKTLSVPNRYKKALSEHEAIYLAIKNKNSQEASELIEQHIKTSY